MNWFEILASLINGVLVIMAVQYLKNYGMPWLKANVPWVLPVLALVAAQLFGFLASLIGGFLGYPIDFSPIVAVLTGSLAVTAYDFTHATGILRGGP